MMRYHSSGQNTYVTNDHFPPISRTLRYKKVTKPLLERKRRARINRCLDELKDLVGALEADGENINKLEKADILELTVRHLKRISRLQDPVQEAHRFQAGFSQCASEACIFLGSLPGMNSAVGKRLIEHLRRSIFKPCSPAYIPAAPPVEDRLSSTAEELRVSASNQRFSPPLLVSHRGTNKLPMSYYKLGNTTLSTLSESSLLVPFCLDSSTSDNALIPSSPSPSPLSDSKTDDNFMWRPW